MAEDAPQLREGSDQGGDENNGGEEVRGGDEGQGGGEVRDGEDIQGGEEERDQSGHGINTFLFKTKLFYSYKI